VNVSGCANFLIWTPPPQHCRSCISPTHLHRQKKRKQVNLAAVSFPELVTTNGSLAENIVPEDPALKFTNVGKLLWSLPELRLQRSGDPDQTDNSAVKRFVKRFFSCVFKPSKEVKEAMWVCIRINTYILIFNTMLQTGRRNHRLLRKKCLLHKNQYKGDSVDALNTVCHKLRGYLYDAVKEGGLIIQALKNHDYIVAQMRKVQHILLCNQDMLNVLTQIQMYNVISRYNVDLDLRRKNLWFIAEGIHSAMGLRDHRDKKLFNLTVTSGEHFGRSVKVQPDAPMDPKTLLWEQVPGYEHRIPCILTSLNRGMQEFDAFRMDNVFGLTVTQGKLDEIRDNIEKGHDTTIDHPGMLTALFKLWLEELPHPLMQVDGTDGRLMSEVLQGTHATDEQIQTVLSVNDERGITSAQRGVLEYVLNILAVRVESLSASSEKNDPETLAKQLVYPLCHKPADSHAGELIIPFLEQCIKYQVKCRQSDPVRFVPCGSMTPVMRKFLTNMLVREHNMRKHLLQVEDHRRR